MGNFKFSHFTFNLEFRHFIQHYDRNRNRKLHDVLFLYIDIECIFNEISYWSRITCIHVVQSFHSEFARICHSKSYDRLRKVATSYQLAGSELYRMSPIKITIGLSASITSKVLNESK